MNWYMTFNTSFQVLAAFLIFVVGYLALFLAIMVCVLVAHFTLEGFRVVRTYLAAQPLQTAEASSMARK